MSTRSRCESRASKACGGNSFVRAAASSIARGNPSRLTQISAIVRALVESIRKEGCTARARCTKSATAANCARDSPSGSCARLGSASDETGNSCSPCTCSTPRLVTSNLRVGQATRSSSICGAAAAICSKLSSTSSRFLSRSASFSRSLVVCSPTSRISSSLAIVGITSSGSEIAARGMKQTPSGKKLRISVATCILRRVLPIPPGPSSVNKRISED